MGVITVESAIEQNLKEFVTQISREKELDAEVVKIAIEQAIEAVSKKNFSRYRKARPELDLETGKLHVFVTKRVVEEVRNFRTEIALQDARKIKPDAEIGEDIEVEIDPSEFGRIAAQSVRQGILQRLKEAERIKIYNDFKPKEGHLVTGVVQRREHNGFIIELGKAEGILPYSEIPSGVKYRYGDRLKFYVTEVKMTSRDPLIRLSRSRPELVLRLFETEVPEISEGVVKIMSIA
ncbi:S1 RNA-binding domain-containing protein, partial [Candidatus Sumerlaeota bacterium]|nr:S1 RNA-binding domain-containing protein [Candidatus Sumerlaeota bacterium]